MIKNLNMSNQEEPKAIKLSEIIDFDDMHSDGVICSSKHLWNEEGLKAEGESGLPIRFRVIYNSLSPFSSSGIFTKQQLNNAFHKIKSDNPWIKTIYHIDLIKEIHGFIKYANNAVSFSIRSPKNIVNFKLPDHLVEDDEKEIITKLNEKFPQGVKIVSRFSTKEGDVDEIYQTVQIKNKNGFISEKEMIETIKMNGVKLEYIRIPSIDHHPISPQTIVKFTSFIQNKFNPETDWLHIHCHGGKGRSTSISIIFDMLQKLEKSTLSEISFKELIKFHKDSGGKDLTPKDTDSEWKKHHAEIRYNNLEKVYHLLNKIDEYGLKPIYSVALEACLLHDKIALENISQIVEKCNINILRVFYSDKAFLETQLIKLHNDHHLAYEINYNEYNEDEDSDSGGSMLCALNERELFMDMC